MSRTKVLLSMIIFSLLLICTGVIKNQTRQIEKKINFISKSIIHNEKDLNESQLDFSYLTSPYILEKKVEYLDNFQYIPMEYSKIFLSTHEYINLQNKLVIQEIQNETKKQKR
tara:strand:+ start:1919 stop:2257 length:339 start_codon:yes stop_codon:yes gene_type:complete